MARRTRRRAGIRDPRRVAGALGLIGLTATVGVKAASGNFTASRAVNSGTVDTGRLQLTIANGDPTAPIQAFNTSFANAYPNYTAHRVINVTNGDAGFASLTISIVDDCVSGTACIADEITNNTSNGMQVRIDLCSIAWRQTGGSSPDEAYTCDGVSTLITADSGLDGGYDPIVGSWNASAASNLNGSAVNYYRFIWKLPDTALDSMQGENARIRTSFTGTQRAGTNK